MVTTEDCPFCDTEQEPYPEFNMHSPLDGDGEVLLKPAVGMFMPGYLLALTRNHQTSFAQLDRKKLAGIDMHLNQYERWLSERFGKYFRIESGSDNLKDCGSGGCIEHAHIHLIPADEDVGPYIQEQLQWQQLNSYEDLGEYRDEPYIYLGRLAAHYVVQNPNLPSQWARRQVATVRGLDNWDWAVNPGVPQLNTTLDQLQRFPLPIFHRRSQ